jgi:bacterioferritin
MKGNEEVLILLNQLLTNELTAINQYFIHAKMCENWGFDRLGAVLRAESIDEMKHADLVISRILFLEGVPNLQRYHKLHVGETVKEQLESDLQLEYAAIGFLNQASRRRAPPTTRPRTCSEDPVGRAAHRLASRPSLS